MKTGTKHDKLVFNISKFIIYAWLVFSIIISLFVNRTFDLNHIIMSIIFYAVIFIPIYLIVFSFPLKKNYKLRSLKSLIALIPVIVSYMLLYERMNFLILSTVKIIGSMIVLFLLNFNLTAQKNDKSLIIFTLISTASSFLIYAVYLKYFSSFDYYSLIGIYNQDEFILSTSIIMMLLFGIIYVFLSHMIILFKLRKEN